MKDFYYRRLCSGGQITRLWAAMNYVEPSDPRDTLVDMMADLYIFCHQHGIAWSDVVSNAEKWGLQETILHDVQRPQPDGDVERLFDAIFGSDPLAANDPKEDGDGTDW